jgi:hypothetical protein
MRELGIFLLAFIALLLLASALGMVGSVELTIIVLLSLAAAATASLIARRRAA